MKITYMYIIQVQQRVDLTPFINLHMNISLLFLQAIKVMGNIIMWSMGTQGARGVVVLIFVGC